MATLWATIQWHLFDSQWAVAYVLSHPVDNIFKNRQEINSTDFGMTFKRQIDNFSVDTDH